MVRFLGAMYILFPMADRISNTFNKAGVILSKPEPVVCTYAPTRQFSVVAYLYLSMSNNKKWLFVYRIQCVAGFRPPGRSSMGFKLLVFYLDTQS